jgi:hypothetical protein
MKPSQQRFDPQRLPASPRSRAEQPTSDSSTEVTLRLLQAELAAAEASVAAAQRTAQTATAAAGAAWRLLIEARAELVEERTRSARVGNKEDVESSAAAGHGEADGAAMLAAEMVARSTALAEVAGLETTVRRLAAEQAESLAEVELLLAEVWAELATERASSARAVAEAAAEVTAAQAAVGRAAAERALLRRAMEEMEEWWAERGRAAAKEAVTQCVVQETVLLEVAVLEAQVEWLAAERAAQVELLAAERVTGTVVIAPAAMTTADPGAMTSVTRTGGRQRKAARLARQAATARLEASLGADWQDTINSRLEVARAHRMVQQ